MKQVIRNIIQNQINEDIFLTSENTIPLKYGDLKYLIDNISSQLSSQGITNKDRAAIVLPNGPYMATSFLSIASYMSAAPLNPLYKADEYEFYLNDLKPKIVIVEPNSENPVIEAANKLNIPICEIKIKTNSPTGIFDLFDTQSEYELPFEDTEALVLHTSGTTSRPKIVPLTNKNICSSAKNISRTLKLSKNDHSLNIMPLFHIHGLVAVLLASLESGASVYASSGFNAIKFLDLAKSENITWYSGVPTMHQAILLRAEKKKLVAKGLKLRFIRSSSASLPPSVFEKLNDIFDCPVIEAYGMTEASHQMSSNPLPPIKQKAGSVGMPAGTKIIIMNEKNKILRNGEIGEICIKGDNVTSGYENNLEANKTSFFEGWFKTGDEGYFDDEGYLKISGRLKEIINKGGEKISPSEIDSALMFHPSIEQVVCFGFKDKMLGEDIGAAIILKKGQVCNEFDIKQFAQNKLAKFKIPKKIFFVSEIPKGSTGKLQRIGLANKFGLE